MRREPIALRPSTANLIFQVFDRSVHPELFESLVCQNFERDGYHLKLRLTPAGHVLEWRRNGLMLVEVLADQTRPLPEQRQVFAHRVGGERLESHSPQDRISYQTCFQLERLAPKYFFHFHDELRESAASDGVLHLLQPNDRLGLSPLSYVDLQCRPGSLLVHVYHTFPEEFAVVKSQSIIEMS